MGSFDIIHVPCAHCDAMNEEQTKSGDCTLSDYLLDEIPPKLAAHLDGFRMTCSFCHQVSIIKTEMVATLTVRKYVPEEDDPL